MKKVLFVFILTITVIFMISTPSCSIIDDITGKDYGAYTSITFEVQITFKGLNSTGSRRFTVNGDVRHNQQFNFDPPHCDDNTTCDNAHLDTTITVQITINSATTTVTLEYLNWNYNNFRIPGTNCKFLCAQFTTNILSYQYESGKDDPGTPIPSGFDQLTLDVNNDCVQQSQRVHDCTSTATITFSRSGSMNAPSSYNVVQSRHICHDPEF